MPSKPTVKFNDGEGLDHNDLNTMGTLTDIKCSDYLDYDRIISSVDAGSSPDYASPSASDEVIYSMGGYAGAPKTNATPGQIELFAGVIAQLLDGTPPDDTVEHLLKYRVDPLELTHTFAAGDPGLDRYDIVGLELTTSTGLSTARDFKDAVTGALTSSSVTKRNYVNASITGFQGTPGAGFPDYTAIRAALGAGVGAVAVCKMAAGGTTHSEIHDLMRPLGQLHTVWLNLNNYENVVGSWALNNGGGGVFNKLIGSTDGTSVRISLSNALPKTARILSVEANVTASGGGHMEMGARDRINSSFDTLDFGVTASLSGSFTNLLYSPEANISGNQAQGALWANGAHSRLDIQILAPSLYVFVEGPTPAITTEIFGIKINYLA